MRERYWSALPPIQRDALGAGLLAVVVLVEVLSVDLAGPLPAVLAQSLVLAGATALRRAAPLVAAVIAALAGTANVLIYSGSEFDFLVTQVWAVVLVAYSVAAHAPRRTSAAAGLVLLVLTFWIDNVRQGSEGFEYVASLVAVGAPWLAGWFVRQARGQAQQLHSANRQLAEERRNAEVAAATAERLRIARELHDIVAHSLTVVALQADAADALLPESPQTAQSAVVTIRTTAHEALGEMRRLLGMLRPAAEEQPAVRSRGLHDVETLVAEARAHAPVELSLQGDRIALPRVVDEAAYRIVQEGLTNARRHGDGDACQVTVRYTADALELDVWNSTRPSTARDSGFGLIGIAERVQALGGQLTAGPAAGRGWALRARLPLGPMPG